MAEPLDLGLAFAEAVLVVLLADLVFALAAAAFTATFTKCVSTRLQKGKSKLTFLVSLFALVVFLVGFFTVAAFLVVVAAFFVEAEGFLVVGAFSVALVLLAGAFFAGAFAFSVAFFVAVLFFGGWVFCIRLVTVSGQ